MKELFLFAVMTGASLFASPSTELPHKLKGVGIDEKMGNPVDVTNVFLTETGRPVVFRNLVVGPKPTILVIAYFNCPMLCGLVQGALLRGVLESGLKAGTDFQIITVSMDPNDKPPHALAYAKKYRDQLPDKPGESAWAFLTGGDKSIAAVTEAAGFRFKKDPESGEFLHAAGIFILTPKGTLSRVFTGAQYKGFDIKLAISEAKEGRGRSVAEHFLLYCYQYNPSKEGYSLKARTLMKMGGGVTLVFLTGLIWLMTRKKKKNLSPRVSP